MIVYHAHGFFTGKTLAADQTIHQNAHLVASLLMGLGIFHGAHSLFFG